MLEIDITENAEGDINQNGSTDEDESEETNAEVLDEPETSDKDDAELTEECVEAVNDSLFVAPGVEAAMFLQAPSSAAKQDVSHVLGRLFKGKFNRPVIMRSTVDNLVRSEEGTEDPYHKHYVDLLRRIHEERDRRLTEANMLERHILQAQARGTISEQHEYNEMSGDSLAGGFSPEALKSCLPPVKAHFRCSVDSSVLRYYDLIAPEDFTRLSNWPRVAPPPRPTVLRHTLPAGQNRNLSSNQALPDINDTVAPPVITPCCDHDCLYADYTADTVPKPCATESMDSKLTKKICRDVKKLKNKTVSLAEKDLLRFGVESLDSRINHLKNPRYQPTHSTVGLRTNLLRIKNLPSVAHKPQSCSDKMDIPVFMATPSVVVFTDYKVGQVYEMELELKNITSVLRPLRVVPPASCYFSVSLGKFPSAGSSMAAGMSCRFLIRFSPDSLCDYDDVITVQSQSRTPLCVPLQARRPPPVLNLPENLNVGSCLVGGMKLTQFTVTNQGGDGRFYVMSPDFWPTVSFRTSPACSEDGSRERWDEGVRLGGVFEVRPTQFDMKRGDMVPVEILFSPRCAMNFSEEILLICDNCNVVKLRITGEGVLDSVDLEYVEGGMSDYLVGEYKDITAQHLIRYPSQPPLTATHRKITVRNNVCVELPFYWIPAKPDIITPDPFNKDDKVNIPKVKLQDLDSHFFIEPREGIFPPAASIDFILTYNPAEVGIHNSCLHLVLRSFYPPECKDVTDKVKSSPDHCAREVISANIKLPNLMNDSCEMCEMTVIELELKGECETSKVCLVPPILQMFGQILQHTIVRKSFKMCNKGPSEVFYRWLNQSLPHVINVEPNCGFLSGDSEQEFELQLSCDTPGNVDQCISCEVSNSTEPLLLRVFANVKGAELLIEEPDVCFGAVRVGDHAIVSLTLRNETRQPVTYSVCLVSSNENKNNNKETIDDVDFCEELVLTPQCDTVSSLDVTKLSVMFSPKSPKSLSCFLKFNFESGGSRVVAVRGESVSPSVKLLSHRLPIGDAFINAPSSHNVILVNDSMLSARYEWGSLEGSGADDCSIILTPRTGVIEPNQSVNVSLTFTGFIEGELNDLYIPCHIEGMDIPLRLYIKANIAGLTVSFSVSDEPNGNRLTNNLTMDFGLCVPIGSIVRRYLHIRNNSSICTAFSVEVEYLRSGLMCDLENTNHTKTRTKLEKLTQLLDKDQKSSISGQCRQVLSSRCGAAFHVTPCEGSLSAFQEIMVEVSAYSDMWGTYSDWLICKVENVQPVSIPMLMTVVGCPLFFLFANPLCGERQAMLRFGSHAACSKTVVKKARIINPSPVDIQVDWRVFDQRQPSSHVLDVVPVFGYAFPPLKSEAGGGGEGSMKMDEWSGPPCDERPKVISIKLRPRIGMESPCPFKIDPSQLMIRAGGEASVKVEFEPQFSTTHEDKCSNEEFMHCGLGYMSLQDKDRCIGLHTRREHQYEVQQLSLCLNAQLVPIRLEVEYHNDENRFDCFIAASQFLVEQDQIIQLMASLPALVPHRLRHLMPFQHQWTYANSMKDCVAARSTAVIFNRSRAPAEFFIESCDPFSTIEINHVTEMSVYDSYLSPDSLRINRTELITLKPNASITVSIVFSLSLSVYKKLVKKFGDGSTSEDDDDGKDINRTVEIPDSGENPPESPEDQIVKDFTSRNILAPDGRNSSALQLYIERSVSLLFSSGSVQTLPVRGSVEIPCFVLSHESLNFDLSDLCYTHSLDFKLSNLSAADCLWSCCIESEEASDIEVFGVTPVDGKLCNDESNTCGVSENICISFTPREVKHYKAVLVFKGILGEPLKKLYISGSGFVRECIQVCESSEQDELRDTAADLCATCDSSEQGEPCEVVQPEESPQPVTSEPPNETAKQKKSAESPNSKSKESKSKESPKSKSKESGKPKK